MLGKPYTEKRDSFTVDGFIDEGVEHRNPTAKVVCEDGFRRVILEQENAYHFIPDIPNFKVVMVSAWMV